MRSFKIGEGFLHKKTPSGVAEARYNSDENVPDGGAGKHGSVILADFSCVTSAS